MTTKHQFLIIATSLAIILWLSDSLIHYYIFDERLELSPDEINELWMRTTITVLLVMFGRYVDYHNGIIAAHEREKLKIYQATIHSTQHILNNLLNQMQLFRMELENPGTFKDEIKDSFEECFAEGKELVQRLSSVNELTAEDILKSVDPEHINH